jgi:hypothetical protein
MTRSNDTRQRLTTVAIDIAKHYHDVLIEPPAPKRRSLEYAMRERLIVLGWSLRMFDSPPQQATLLNR